MSGIVVGIDGSEGSIRALRFAIDEARARNTQVKAVSVWSLPVIAYDAGWAVGGLDPVEYEQAARGGLESALQEANAGASGIEVEQVVVQGQAADVLCEQARGADLLVVGSRGLGGFRGLLLGSVGQQCAQHAPCPVAVVPRDGT